MLFSPLFVLSLCLHKVFGADPYVWPLPKQYTISDTLDLSVSSDFKFVSDANGNSSKIFQDAVERYTYISFSHTASTDVTSSDAITQLVISISSSSEDLQLETDESYTLLIPEVAGSQIGKLTANTIYGAMHGLETFSQLVIYNFTLGYYQLYSSNIIDSPRFEHRGVMIDTSRHFQSVDSIKHVIESMSYAKFNTLHWHLVDSQSFPYESISYPKLWNGAYSNYERFSQNDVSEVVEFAKYHGIRVIPEFDMPGHAQSWCTGYPDICPSADCNSPLNPASNDTWDLVDGLIGEATTLFFDNYFHLGGDEVDTTCWSETDSIKTWMSNHNYTSKEALQYFDQRAENITYKKYNKNVINWVEVFNLFNNSLDRNMVTIEVWKAKTALQAVVKAGFHGILADNDLWYLDNLKTTWDMMYSNEPYEDITNTTQQNLIIGGECCMWGETVDVSDIQQTIWPRAAAVAERLWSLENVTSIDNATPRIAYFRCLLNQRGIAAAPFNNTDAREAPPEPGSCYQQRR